MNKKKANKLRSRKLVIIVLLIALLFFIFSILLSINWPSSWNQMLGSTILNISASLIGVLIGILCALFIVQKYLDDGTAETIRAKQIRKQIYMTNVSLQFRARLSCHFEYVINLSHFFLYGRQKWIDLSFKPNGSPEVPETMYEFFVWFVKIGMDKQMSLTDLNRFEKAFDSGDTSQLQRILTDFKLLCHSVENCQHHVADFLFLFQPFIEDNFEMARNLTSYSRDLDNFSKLAYSYTVSNLKEDSIILVNANLQSAIRSLAKSSINIYSLTHSFFISYEA